MTTGNLESASQLVAQLKKKYGIIFQVEATHADTGEPLTAYFRRPGLPELDKFVRTAKKAESIASMRNFAASVFIGGDRAVVDHDYTFFSVAGGFDEILAVRPGVIKKL